MTEPSPFTFFSWQMAELLAKAHMVHLGFTDAQTTRAGADGGLDITATGAAAQVKFLTQPVGSPDIQRLRGAAHSYENALFYSSSGYSSAAQVAANESRIGLFVYDSANRVEPVNETAKGLGNRHGAMLGEKDDPFGDDLIFNANAVSGAVMEIVSHAIDTGALGTKDGLSFETVKQVTDLSNLLVQRGRERSVELANLESRTEIRKAKMQHLVFAGNKSGLLELNRQLSADMSTVKRLAEDVSAHATALRDLVPVSEDDVQRHFKKQREARLLREDVD